ncbi:hypothetical protein [Cardinium endosymbiont of Sogatella furcifera]|uniref:hypothetical protein n=1 Tax=Cardinium endosymbiont of Sogatella furcifera TaxID=650378 RepID=UPI000E0D392E|nr:hypothetical protein [Cardinium endosymbiont of Sogatella furcifera]
MRKKAKGIAQFIGLTAGWMFSFCMPSKADASAVYTLRTITITSTGAIAPTPSYPYLRLLRWLTPTTHASLIRSYISLAPGVTFDAQTRLAIKQRLMALPYFSTVSVTCKQVKRNSATMLSDLIIETKDQFPITVDVSLDEGPLCTLTHHNVGGYGHRFSNQLFLKKRWGYGFIYELPHRHGNYFLGGQCYNQTGIAYSYNYKFNYKNLWVGKLFAIQTKEPYTPYSWIIGLSSGKQTFTARPPDTAMSNTTYQNNSFLLGKVGWVAADYTTTRGVYRLHALETLPKGGSIEILYGYQKGKFNNRQYIGIHCIKNIADPRLRYLHLSCSSGTFINKKRCEEAILKLALAYAGPPIQTCKGARQFITIDYIAGYRMPKERQLGIRRRDPESLALPDEDNSMQAPIHARLTIHLDSTLHIPIMIPPIRFACLGFVHFIALYNQNQALLNQTWVDSYGIGLQVEHVTMSWLAATLRIGYSPFLGKVVPSVQLSMGHFKHTTDPKPSVVAYS